jgi:hypothetical protein
MNSNVFAHAAVTAVKSAASQTGAELPTQSRSLQVADFERLMSQANEQQAQVQLANPVGELGQKGMQHMVKEVGESSRNVATTMESSRQAVAALDTSDPASILKAVQHMDQAMAAAGHFSIMLSEVKAARKGLGELFHAQG